jgi:phosphoribosylformylglycinamidine (FGAM) synthase-like enzyme
MSFCKGGFTAVKSFMHKVDEALINTMTVVTDITGEIKSLEGDATVIQIESLIPNGSAYAAAFATAVDKLSAGVEAGLSFAEKFVHLLAGQSEDSKDATLLKIASLATAAQDQRYPQHLYDTAVQVHLEGLK